MIVGIIGLGLIGASYAAGLKAAGHTILGHDRDASVMKRAEEEGIVDGDYFQDPFACDALILALLPEANVAFVRTHASRLKAGLVLSDVAGVKKPMMDAIEATIPKGVHYLSHHPMAGNPEGGFKNHDKALFRGANAIFVEGTGPDQKAATILKGLVEDLGMRKTLTVSKATHDAFIAHTSQLTHLIASALILSNGGTIPLEASGNSYRDLTRIGDIDAALWTPLFMANKAALLKALSTFKDAFSELETALQEEDYERVEALLQRTRKLWRDQNH
ncbi:MAG: prephenate dehydrogenase [Candidatus Izemoplasmataceae bacterium]